jgi:TonB family protein
MIDEAIRSCAAWGQNRIADAIARRRITLKKSFVPARGNCRTQNGSRTKLHWTSNEMHYLLKLVLTAQLVAAVISTTARAVAGEDTIDTARELYAAAAYEDALSLLNRLQASDHRPDDDRTIAQYRALCLFALGQPAEAEKAIEAVVAAAPSYRLTDVDVSPRVRSAFFAVRQRVLPGLIEQKYAEGKAAFVRKDFVSAAEVFNLVVELLDDSDIASAAKQPPLSILRIGAVEFRDLSKAAALPPTARPVPVAVPPPAPPPSPPSAKPNGPLIYGPDDANVVAPITIRQSLPVVDGVFAIRQGIVEVIINEAGEVESATIRMSVNPVYDRLVLATAKSWRYKPATLNGVPVKFRKIIQFDLRPR